jgi:hypothetical protein
VKLNLVFNKLNPSDTDNLLEYKIIASINEQSREVKSEVEALNSLQIIDRGSIPNPSNTLAYRTDPRPTELSDTEAAVTMVLDKSGSMAWKMDGNEIGRRENPNLSRMNKLKVEALRLIDGLSSNPNIYLSIIPFDSTANNPQAMLPVRVNDTANNVLIQKVNSLTANGGTNTGDGLRRGYFITKDFNDSATKTVKNFMIVLVDGVTTFYSATQVQANSRDIITNVDYVLGNNNIDNSKITQYNRYYPNGGYSGEGNKLDEWGTAYVDEIGSMIRKYGTGATSGKQPISVYVIGFSANRSDYGSLRDIAEATTGNTKYYEAGDSAALESIFASIQKDINDSLWHIGGPT